MRTLSHAEAKAFYDWFGAWQDSQRFYEDAAIDDLIAHAEFAKAQSVLEFGCGTGRFAEQLLSNILPAKCRYRALDVSETMVRIAQQRLAHWGERVSVEQTSGAMTIAGQSASVDRFVVCYVLDLLSEQDIHNLLAEAYRLVAPHGLLCSVASTRGTKLSAQAVGAVWQALFRLNPKLVGGCRALVVRVLLDDSTWSLRYSDVVTRFGLSSDVLVATPKPLINSRTGMPASVA